MSDNPSTRDYRITKAYFRICSIVYLAVKPACAFTLETRLPTALSRPLHSSVTLWEETAPVKLPT